MILKKQQSSKMLFGLPSKYVTICLGEGQYLSTKV